MEKKVAKSGYHENKNKKGPLVLLNTEKMSGKIIDTWLAMAAPFSQCMCSCVHLPSLSIDSTESVYEMCD